jgi:hypothetical protein
MRWIGAVFPLRHSAGSVGFGMRLETVADAADI